MTPEFLIGAPRRMVLPLILLGEQIWEESKDQNSLLICSFSAPSPTV